LRLREKSAPYLFLLPYFLVTAVFFLYPLIYATVLAFYQTNGPLEKPSSALATSRTSCATRFPHRSLEHDGLRLLLDLPAAPAVAGLAMLLNARTDRLKGFFRLAIFAPNLVGQVFVAILFSMLFTPRYGLFNRFLQRCFTGDSSSAG
jgi:ABC-type sugar transport system permease subunit